MPARCARASCS